MGRAPDPQPVLIDPRYFDNRKLRSVGAHGRELHLRAICFSNLNLTDGVITHEEAAELAGRVLAQGNGQLVEPTRDERDALLHTLVTARLLDAVAVGYAIHDYGEHQLLRSEILEEELAAAHAALAEAEEASRLRFKWRNDKRRQRGMSTERPPDVHPASVTATALQNVSSQSATAQYSGGLLEDESEGLTWTNIGSYLSDADDRTSLVVQSLRRRFRLPEAALHNAMQALVERRARTPQLVSEARYFVATLKALAESGQYAREVA